MPKILHSKFFNIVSFGMLAVCTPVVCLLFLLLLRLSCVSAPLAAVHRQLRPVLKAQFFSLFKFLHAIQLKW